MRVLHIFSGNLYGGVERMLQTLAECKSECPEMEPSFAYCFEGRLSRELRQRGEPLYHLGEARVRWLPSVWRVRKALRRLLAQQPMDCVISHGSWLQAIFGPVIRSAGMPVVFWQHDVPEGKHWVQRWSQWSPPDFVFSDSKFLDDGLWKLYPGIPSSPFYYAVLPPERDFSDAERSNLREELATARDAVVIIQVSPQQPKEEKYLDSLKALAASYGVADRVRFLGQRSDVPRLLHAADIFTQPNVGVEPFGTVFIEAMYAGLPVVTTNFGGAPEVVGESCGVLVPPGDTDALSQELGRLVNSPELRAALGSGGPDRARQLTDPHTRLNKLCDQLLDIAAKHGSTLVRTTNGANR